MCINDFVPNPSPFKTTPLGISYNLMPPRLQHEIQKGANRDEPSVHFAQSFHEHLESSIYPSSVNEAFGKMRIHNGRTAFSG